MLDNIAKYEVVLASKSPRRKELLGMLAVPFEIKVKEGIDESYPADMPAIEVAEFLARKKGKAYAEDIKYNEMVITADTIVILDGKIYGKPHSEEDAVNMLIDLQGRTHTVASGVCVASKEKIISFTTTTEVTFAPLTKEEAEWYVKNFRPLDKAGAYGIQEWIGCAAVARIDGSFYNVMGLPVHQLYNVLKNEF